MKKLIFIFLLIAGYSYGQDPYGLTAQSANLYHYANIDSNNTFSGTQTFNTIDVTTYKQSGTTISWGASTVSQTGLNNSFPDTYTSLDSLTLGAGTYCIVYSMHVKYLAGSGTTTQDHAYMRLFQGSQVTNSEVWATYSYTVVGVSGDIRVLSWNVVVTPSTSTKYYFQTKQISETGLAIKLQGYVVTAIKIK